MRNATDIILLSILNDPTRLNDLQQIINGCSTPEARAAAVRGYCGRSLGNCLTVEKEVVESLIDGASWDDVAARLNAVLQTENVSTSGRGAGESLMLFGQS